jgi:transcriptional regulator with XRE-family HTH domain
LKVLAIHVAKAHGVDRFELRKAAGMRRSDTACSPEVHEFRHDLYFAREEPPRSPGGQSSLTAEQLAEIRDLYASGSSLRVLAKRFGMEKTQIGRILRSAGVELRQDVMSGAKLNLEQVRQIRAWAPSVSHAELAAKFGVTPSLIYQIRTRRIWKDIDAGSHQAGRGNATSEGVGQ